MKTSYFGTGGARVRRFIAAALLIAVCNCLVSAAAADETTFDRIVGNLEQMAPTNEAVANDITMTALSDVKGIRQDALVITRPDSHTLCISGGGADQKKEITNMIMAEFENSAKASASGSMHDYDCYKRSYSGSYLTGISDIEGYYLENCIVWCKQYGIKFSGTQMGQWEGSNPANADKITLLSTLTVRGDTAYFLSASDYNEISPKKTRWTDTFSNEWLAIHYYDNCQVTWDYHDDEVRVPYIYQADAATFKFGGSSYTINTHVDIP